MEFSQCADSVCKSAPVCAAGVTGSNLKKRIEGIMRHRTALQLGFSRKLLLVLAAITALAGPVAIGVVNAKLGWAQSDPANRPAFEVASVKIAKEDGGTGPRNSRRSYGPQGIDFGGLALRPRSFSASPLVPLSGTIPMDNI